MEVNDAGEMVLDTWHLLSNRFPTIDLDAFIVMPNHVHGIIMITGNDAHDNVPAHDGVPMDDGPAVGATLVVAHDNVPAHGKMPARDRATTRVAPTLGDVIGAYKSVVTVQYTRGVKTHGWTSFRNRLWQRNYYEHVIRDDDSLDRIRQYILDNPRRWDEDRYNPNVLEENE
jgi:REP element-mobilizing transposase RayT